MIVLLVLHAAPLLKTTLEPREDIQVLYGDHTKRLIRTLAIMLLLLPLAVLRLRRLRDARGDSPDAAHVTTPSALTSPPGPLSKQRGGEKRAEVKSPLRVERGFRGEVRSWLAGFALTLILVVSFVVYVNPRKYYGTNFFESPWMQMRWFKTEYYARLPRTPDVVIIGSSRAFQISPTTIEEKLGYSAFNAAVDGGNIGDALVMAKFMLERHDHRLPEVLLIEVTPPLQKGTSRTATRSPVSLLPYMPPDTTQHAITERLIALLDVQQLSEAIYTIRRHVLYGRFEKPVALHPDGQVSQFFDPAEFNTRLERTLNQGGDMVCDDLDAEGVRIVDELIGLASDQGSAIIFYISPRHPRYYARFGDDPDHVRCHQEFVQYMHDLRRDHPNVFFLDYSRIESFGGTPTTRGFYDVFHITEYNGDLIIDAAADTIRQAYRTAIQQRVRR